MAAYNPGGAEPPGDAGPRRGLPLLGRLARPQLRTRVFEAGDGNGLYRRIYLTASCANVANIARQLEPARARSVTGLGPLFAAGRTVRPMIGR